MLWVFLTFSLFFNILLIESILISREWLFRGACFLFASNTTSQVFSNVNKQPSLEWCCVNLKGEIMAKVVSEYHIEQNLHFF